VLLAHAKTSAGDLRCGYPTVPTSARGNGMLPTEASAVAQNFKAS
jgi:hypothetical protein